MTRVEIVDGRLQVEVLGWDKLWAFKRGFDIPLEQVVGVRSGDKEKWFDWSLRAPGTSWPGVIRAGSYLRKGEWTFWDVHKMERAIVIELHNEPYHRLVIEVENPDAVIRLIRELINPEPALSHG